MLGAFLLTTGIAQAQVPSDPFNYARTSSFTYYGGADGAKNGLLKSETVEPENTQSCVTTTYDYDAYGNKKSAVTANCAGAVGNAVFTSRSSGSTYAALPSQTIQVGGASVAVSVPAGVFPTASTNALSQSENKTYDPRFGAALTLTGPNGLTTRWVLDDFGRKVKELRADNTSSVSAYCVLAGSGLDASGNSNTANGDPLSCPTPATGEAPADAVMFVHNEPRDASGAKMGAFVRVYTDRMGRELRSVTESFDGASQPAGRSAALVVKDSVYNAFGAKIIESQPYFLASVSSTTAGASDVGLARTDYDVLGRPIAVYVADVHGSQAGIAFGAFGSRQAARQTVAYAGLATTSTNDKGQTRTEEKNPNGELVRVTDATGAQLAHQRDAFGNLVATKDALQNTITLVYDIRGRKTQMKDPDTGTWQYDYDALGQLVWQQSPNQAALKAQTTMAYDVLGRMTSRVEPEYTSTWSYDKYADGSACTKGIGKLCESNTTNGVNRKLVYDSLGRPVNSRTTVSTGPSFATALAYDASTGRVTSQLYPTGLQVGYAYSARGFLEKLTLLTAATVTPLPNSQGQTASGTTLVSGSVLWQAQVVNAWGKTEQQVYGNNVVTRAVFEAATGRTSDLSAGTSGTSTVLSHHYTWDSLNNLVGRTDDNGDGGSGAVTETFAYADSLNRLTQYQVSAPAIPNLTRSVTLQYNALGMLLYKSDVGNYSYSAQGATSVRPHALQSVTAGSTTGFTYDANGNLVSATAGKYRSISYTSFNLPDSQTGIQGPAGSPKYTWQYDEGHARIKETHTDASGTRTIWYAHPDNQGGLGFESEAAPSGTISNRHYLSAGGASIGVLVSTGALPTLTSTQTAPTTLTAITLVKVEYWHKDHLGSLAATTDHTGAVTQRYAYDPFGKRRYTNGNYDAFGNLVIDWSPTLNAGTDRGFTGHEQLDDIGLLHMNGRIYDPTLGVFLQGDPMVGQPDDLQNYNRYGYCFNNPLTCTDPTGFDFWSHLRHGVVNTWHSVWHNPVFRVALSITAMVCLGPESAVWGEYGFLGGITASPLVQTAIAGFVSGAIATGTVKGGVQGAFTAAMFFEAGELISGKFEAVGEIKDNVARVAIHGVVGCVTSMTGGGKCGPGALSAAFTKAAAPGIMNQTGENRVLGAMAAAVVGGTASVLGGGKFANGAETGAFSYLFNDVLHDDKHYAGDNRRVLAVADGVVTDAGWENPADHNQGFGFRVKITTIDQQQTWIYAHMDPDALQCYQGEVVLKGEYIGDYASPANGNVTGPHLHLELRAKNGTPILVQGDVYPIPGGRMSSGINPNRTIVTNNGRQSRPHNGTDWVGGP